MGQRPHRAGKAPPVWEKGRRRALQWLSLPLALLLPLALCSCAGLASSPVGPERPRAPINPAETPAPPLGEGLGPIVIDPGHGGADTGALAPGGYAESELVLEVALRLKDALAATKGIPPVQLTRESDLYVPLQERMALANRLGASVFLSIHANSGKRRSARGVETYLLNAEASDDDARRVALAENAVLHDEGGDPNDPLFLTLLSLASAEQIKRSEELAGLVQTRLAGALKTEDRGVRQAPFFVLSRAQMPSVLVEIGFISNPGERDRLREPAYQEKLSGALAEAIVTFLRQSGQLAQRR